MIPNNQTPQGEAIHMASLYTKDGIIGKLWEQFSEFFSEQTNPTAQHLFELVLSVFALNGFQSVKYSFDHFIGKISRFELKSFYYALNKSKISLEDWMKHLIEAALSMLCESPAQALILAIDDTLIEKFGQHFEHRSRLFDHAAHDGDNYLDGHCFVSLLLSVPVQAAKQYLSFPVAYRMWTKAQTKLEMAAQLVRSAMNFLGLQRQIILCCDSWYPKSCVKALIEEYANLVMICNVRTDTAIYALPPIPSGRRGRPRVRGERLALTDFVLKEVADSDFLVGCRPVKTMLFGARTVWAIVTKARKGKHYRLFLCTQDPKQLQFDLSFADTKASVFAQADPDFLPLTIYALRWNIEVSYYEQKTFWALGDYRLRSQSGIERLVNLLTLCYSSVKLLPYLSQDFSALKDLSAQQARFKLGELIRREVFFAAFVDHLETTKNSSALVNLLKSRIFPFLSAA